MSTFIHTLAEHAYQNRTVALVEGGSWAPAAAKIMTKEGPPGYEVTSP